MKNFKDFLTPGRERVLQAADIHGDKLKKSAAKSTEWLKGDTKQQRALAIFNRAMKPTPENKEKAKYWKDQSRFWK